MKKKLFANRVTNHKYKYKYKYKYMVILSYTILLYKMINQSYFKNAKYFYYKTNRLRQNIIFPVNKFGVPQGSTPGHLIFISDEFA